MIHIKEILNIIKHSNYEESVEITSDSCHSGMICHQAKKWFESHRNKDDICFKNIFIMASTYKKNKGAWGRYRNFKSTHQKEYNTNTEKRKSIIDYTSEFGVTMFMSR